MTDPLYGPPIILDGMTAPMIHEYETAWQFGCLVGELDLHEETNAWRARKLFNGKWGNWRPMRCRAEARAFIVSKVRQ